MDGRNVSKDRQAPRLGKTQEIRPMRVKSFGVVAGIALLTTATAAPALAHHSFAAEFDRNAPVHLEGVVVEFEWVNPHSWLVIDVESEDGTTERWRVEGGAPSALLRRGWTRDTLPAGTSVIVDGFQAKDGKPRANASAIEFPDGTKLSLGQSRGGTAPGQEE
jgi:hypothetical protein